MADHSDAACLHAYPSGPPWGSAWALRTSGLSVHPVATLVSAARLTFVPSHAGACLHERNDIKFAALSASPCYPSRIAPSPLSQRPQRNGPPGSLGCERSSPHCRTRCRCCSANLRCGASSSLFVSVSNVIDTDVRFAHLHWQWSTTWDRSRLFTYTNLSPNPINFVSPGSTGAADISVDDTSVLQSMAGYGATLSMCRYSPAFREQCLLTLVYSRQLGTASQHTEGL